MSLKDRKGRFNRKWMKEVMDGAKETILCLGPTALTLIYKNGGILFERLNFMFFVCLFLGRTVRHTGNLVSQPGIEPGTPSVEARSPNH